MISWHCKHFSDLSTREFHDLIQLRINVFIIEQNCPYPELDNKDLDSFHIFGINENGQTIAVSRIVKPGVSYDEISIGRVATDTNFRQTRSGIQLMEFTIKMIHEKFGLVPIRISAQEYLKSFYEKFGFVKVSDSYLEDDIPHIEMLRN